MLLSPKHTSVEGRPSSVSLELDEWYAYAMQPRHGRLPHVHGILQSYSGELQNMLLERELDLYNVLHSEQGITYVFGKGQDTVATIILLYLL